MGRELNGGWEGRLESENGAVIHTLMMVGTKKFDDSRMRCGSHLPLPQMVPLPGASSTAVDRVPTSLEETVRTVACRFDIESPRHLGIALLSAADCGAVWFRPSDIVVVRLDNCTTGVLEQGDQLVAMNDNVLRDVEHANEMLDAVRRRLDDCEMFEQVEVSFSKIPAPRHTQWRRPVVEAAAPVSVAAVTSSMRRMVHPSGPRWVSAPALSELQGVLLGTRDEVMAALCLQATVRRRQRRCASDQPLTLVVRDLDTGVRLSCDVTQPVKSLRRA